jgi:hypothetical protein
VKNRKAKLMKNLSTSDINPMVLSTMNNAAVRLAMPVSTAVIWGANVGPGANSAIWGTSAVGGANKRQDFSAIWGTSGIWAPMQQARPLPSMEIST